MKLNRREFIASSFFGVVAATLIGKAAWMGQALAASFRAPAPKDAADPTKPGPAKAMKYVHHVAEYKGPPKKAGAKCLNCLQFKPAKAGEPWGKCAMVGNKQVYEDGMCQVWAANPKVPI